MLSILNKLIYSFIWIVIAVSYSQICHIPFLRNKNFINRNTFEFTPHLYRKGYNSKMYYSKGSNFISSGKIDIYTGNHYNYLDFISHLSIIKQFYDGDIYIIYSKYVENLPIVGRFFKYSNNIGIKKKIHEDEKPLIDFIKKTNKGIIMIYPEGTRVSSDKIIKSNKYTKENFNKEFNNILCPKFKGLHLIINKLHEYNKLGNIIDGSVKVNNLNINNKQIKDILLKDISKTYCHIRTYVAEPIEDYDKFKLWFLQIWTNKDKYLTNYKKYKYDQIDYKMKTSILIMNLFVTYFIVNILIYLYTSKDKKLSFI